MKNPILFFYLLMICMATGCSKPEPKTDSSNAAVIKKQNDLPKMIIRTMDESTVNTNELMGKTIIILFQPDCDHCQREAEEIREHLEAFKNYNLYFITSAEKVDVEKFGKDYDLAGHKNIYFGLTSTDEVLKNFGPIPAPSMYIYVDQLLVQKFNGETEIEKILLAI